jgi:Xaa-Pro aminopeptidase
MDMPAHLVLGIQLALPRAKLVIGEPAVSELRRCKEAGEIDAMKRAGDIADRAFEAVMAKIQPGVTELQIHRALEIEMERLGGRPTFCTVAFGPGSAEPHHLSDSTELKDGEIVLMDFGCDVDHYQSDITRVVCCGRATDEMKQVYDIVHRSHQAARAAISVGVQCQEIDRVGRKVINDAGYGEYFFHRIGHGIGMQVHETPYMVEGNSEPLREGECFSIEPGIYMAGKWGIRIENIVSATQSGHISMNKEPSPHLVEIEA